MKLRKGAEPDVALHKQRIAILLVLAENLTHNHNLPLSSRAAKWDKPVSPRAAGEQQRCWAGDHSPEPLELLQLLSHICSPNYPSLEPCKGAHSKGIYSKVSCSSCTEFISLVCALG